VAAAIFVCIQRTPGHNSLSSGHLIRVAFQFGLDIDRKGWINCRKGTRPCSSAFGDQCRGRKSDDSRRQVTGSGPHHIPPCSLGQVRRIPCDTTAKTSARELFVLDGSESSFEAAWRDFSLASAATGRRTLTILYRAERLQSPVLIFYNVEWVPPSALLEGWPFGAQKALVSGLPEP